MSPQRVGDRLAAVERFERGQLLGVLLDQVGQLEHEPAAVGGVHLPPGAGFQRLAGGLDGPVDVGLVAFGDLAMVSPVAGLMAGKVLPETLSSHLPPMNSGWSFTCGALVAFGLLGAAVAMSFSLRLR